MKNFSHKIIPLGLIGVMATVLALLPGVINAADEDQQGTDNGACPEIVRQALDLTSRECDDTGRNEACYGHVDLEAQPQPEADSFIFTEAGDIVKIDQMRSLRLGEMNVQTEAWGIALLRVQANLSDTSPENVTLILFGETEITDASPDVLMLPVRAAADQNVNARSYPGSNARILQSLPPGTEVMATGRLADNSWLRIMLPETNVTAWVYVRLMEVEGDLSTLTVVDAGETYYRPMQAFTLMTGVDDAPCAEAPNSGMVIQTPEGAGRVTFLVNEVDIQVGATVFMQSEPGERLDVAVIEGTAEVTANGVTQVVPAGTVVSVPLGANGLAAGQPGVPRAYPAGMVQGLPTSLLPRTFAVAVPYVQTNTTTTTTTTTTTGGGATSGGATGGGSTGGDVPTGGGGAGETVPTPFVEPTAVPPQPTAAPTYTVCHVANMKTLSGLSYDDYMGHLAHGDHDGPC